MFKCEAITESVFLVCCITVCFNVSSTTTALHEPNQFLHLLYQPLNILIFVQTPTHLSKITKPGIRLFTFMTFFEFHSGTSPSWNYKKPEEYYWTLRNNVVEWEKISWCSLVSMLTLIDISPKQYVGIFAIMQKLLWLHSVDNFRFLIRFLKILTLCTSNDGY